MIATVLRRIAPARTPARRPRQAGLHVRALTMLITRVPDRTAVRVIAAVTATLSMLGMLVFGALSDTEFGPHLQQAIAVGVAVPVIVVMPFASVAIQLVRDLDAQRNRAMALAAVDPLTGLYNRRRLAGLMERDLGLARRMGTHLTVALLDIDDFKSVNDVHGHATGDALLRAVADACRTVVRGTDIVGRWGGEEFVVLLPATGADGAAVLLDRLRRAIAAVAVTDEAGRTVSRTVSIGAVALAPSGARGGAALSMTGLLSIADRAMYRAKIEGKDRTRLEALGPTGAPATPAAEPAAAGA